MNLVGDFMDNTTIYVDNEIIDILLKEYKKFKNKKASMFMNEGGTLIKNFDTSNMMYRILDISTRIHTLKGKTKPVELNELLAIQSRYNMLANALLKSKYFNQEHTKDVEELKEKIESLVIAVKLIDY